MQRLGANLDEPQGTQKVADIEAEIAAAQTAMATAKDRHTQTANTLNDMLQSVEGVSPEQVGVEILALQTRLQASMQTTALLYQTSLVNYLPR
jgi:flagellin-like hook-associated protein FlgL